MDKNKITWRIFVLSINIINIIVSVIYAYDHGFFGLSRRDIIDFFIPLALSIIIFGMSSYILLPFKNQPQAVVDRSKKLMRGRVLPISIFYPLFIIFPLSQAAYGNMTYHLPGGFNCSQQNNALYITQGSYINCLFSTHDVLYSYLAATIIILMIGLEYMRSGNRAR